MDRIDRIRKGSFITQAREHEVNEAKPGSAGHLTGFIDFAFGDQRLAVGSRPAGRRWRIGRNNVLFAVPQLRDGQFQVPPRDPPPELF